MASHTASIDASLSDLSRPHQRANCFSCAVLGAGTLIGGHLLKSGSGKRLALLDVRIQTTQLMSKGIS